jgi:hemolysin D
MVNKVSYPIVDRHPEPTIKILLVDDLRVIREKLKSILNPDPDIQVIGMAVDGDSAIDQLKYLAPDIILLDIDMPRLDGIQTARIINHKYPHIKIIILSSYELTQELSESLSAYTHDYLVKDNLDLKLADMIRAVAARQASSQSLDAPPQSLHQRDKIVEFNRSVPTENLESIESKNRQNNIAHTGFGDNLTTQFTSIYQTTFSSLNDWSNAAKELIDMMPLPWTRGLLYLLVALIGILIPWACLYRMDEIGTARGRLEFKGNTIKREADIEGSVAVIKVHVKKGDRVKAGQTIMELDSKNVREQLTQNQLKLDGYRQQLNQLLLMKNQVGLGTNAQSQQNQAQLLEKQSQIAQAQQSIANLQSIAQNQVAEKLTQLHQSEQTLADRQSSYNLQKAEKLTQVRQAEQGVVDAQTNYLLTQNRLKDAQNEVDRYHQLYQTGAIAQVKSKEIASIALEKNQLFTQAFASLQQSKLRVKEQQENYQKLLQQARADIAQARLRLKEQQEIYQGTVDRTQSDIAQAKLRLTEQQRGSQSLAKGGNIALLRTDQQLKEIESQIVTLKSQIDRDLAQTNFLTKQLDKYTIKANADGTIFELPIDREGAVVQPKQLIAEIASNTSGLVFKGEIPATQSESLRSSLDDTRSASFTPKDVKLKFDEFPFESYDVVKGKLTWIAPNSKLTQISQGGSSVSYEIEVQLGQACIKHEGNCIPFKSGQPATAEIVIRNRRIIDFVLDPFKKLSNK